MMYGFGQFGWGMGLIMLGVVAAWAAIVWLAILLIRHRASAPNEATSAHSRAEEVLAERLARGEIDVDEFTARRNAIRAS